MASKTMVVLFVVAASLLLLSQDVAFAARELADASGEASKGGDKKDDISISIGVTVGATPVVTINTKPKHHGKTPSYGHSHP
ncbi:uncharacterized protein [Oryza sativa Japonica Group]|uniref:Os06g0316000 protein n=7 Tax=Oryza TaxID=4527 RepID=A3BB54_ORYSJ|nr:uncharacterized protein LOC4340874 [Oryza sativa Japonica Group]XP_052159710.1 uncharacterized protein LOC127777203 [Oryza glaberrima]EAZ00703.1 hypothetical protein OsI_22729 [Oryza sativa Indica Group]KAB8102269.1 hypothetical protein EE612_033678 [Oryza sativa]EAZ36793.1 hypothetical protein OsJ_21132 [Oryza sativa Japonica Group]KAF2926509.1 hypothetical protein DAI22_06g133200 [Oryza sativa Japonica Group]BAD62274.1 unknown protein [Oryza sativa Japonica Group]|eukprot:NP_001057495.1 Os06g0316000 [Oryza sativa Japonica Group]